MVIRQPQPKDNVASTSDAASPHTPIKQKKSTTKPTPIIVEEEEPLDDDPLIKKKKKKVQTPPQKKQKLVMRGTVDINPILLRGEGGEGILKNLQHEVPIPDIVQFKTEKEEERREKIHSARKEPPFPLDDIVELSDDDVVNDVSAHSMETLVENTKMTPHGTPVVQKEVHQEEVEMEEIEEDNPEVVAHQIGLTNMVDQVTSPIEIDLTYQGDEDQDKGKDLPLEKEKEEVNVHTKGDEEMPDKNDNQDSEPAPKRGRNEKEMDKAQDLGEIDISKHGE